MSESQEEPKLIIDEDWKTQVQKEKANAAATTEAADVSSEDTVSQPSANEPATELPEASFASIVSMFFTQSMLALGQFADPNSGKANVDKKVAKHYIDSLEVLQDKSKGNLTSDEEKMISEALHALRMAFLSAK